MRKVLKIEGMSCMHCVNAVKKAFEAIDGVSNVIVDLEEKTATMEADNTVDDDILISAVEEEGYNVVE